MTVYLVWDWDPMASSMGEEYIADIYGESRDAEQEVEKRNKYWRAVFVKHHGEPQTKREPWAWNRARLQKMTVK